MLPLVVVFLMDMAVMAMDTLVSLSQYQNFLNTLNQFIVNSLICLLEDMKLLNLFQYYSRPYLNKDTMVIMDIADIVDTDTEYTITARGALR